jgi:REP element-mobilizing transposase RayT
VARPLRLQVADGIYHVTARGNERKSIYRDATDRQRCLEILAAAHERFRWRCLSYCLMSNHYHLLVRTLEPNLSRGMRDLNGVYAQFFNRRHERVGHLFQGRYRAILIEGDEHLLAVVAYIVRNPVRAGMCETLGEWPWSSHGAALGDRPPGLLALGELLGYFAPKPESARERYRELTESTAWDDPAARSDGVVVGSDEFVRRQLRGVDPCTEIPARHRRPPAPPLPDIFSDCDGSDAIARAYEHGYTMPAIARHLGLHPSTVSRRLARRSAQIKT